MDAMVAFHGPKRTFGSLLIREVSIAFILSIAWKAAVSLSSSLSDFGTVNIIVIRWDKNASGPVGTVASSDAQLDEVREESVIDLSSRKEVFDRLTLLEVDLLLYVWRGLPDVGVGSSSL